MVAGTPSTEARQEGWYISFRTRKRSSGAGSTRTWTRSPSKTASRVPAVENWRGAGNRSTTLWRAGSSIGGSFGAGRLPSSPARRAGSSATVTWAVKKARGVTGYGFSRTSRRATSNGGTGPPGAGLNQNDGSTRTTYLTLSAARSRQGRSWTGCGTVDAGLVGRVDIRSPGQQSESARRAGAVPLDEAQVPEGGQVGVRVRQEGVAVLDRRRYGSGPSPGARRRQRAGPGRARASGRGAPACSRGWRRGASGPWPGGRSADARSGRSLRAPSRRPGRRRRRRARRRGSRRTRRTEAATRTSRLARTRTVSSVRRRRGRKASTAGPS